MTKILIRGDLKLWQHICHLRAGDLCNLKSLTAVKLPVTGLTVKGTTTTINTTDLVIKDKKIVIAESSATNSSSYENAGIYLGNESSSFYIKYSNLNNWEFSSDLNLKSGNSFLINSNSVLNSTTLGASVKNSSLKTLAHDVTLVVAHS